MKKRFLILLALIALIGALAVPALAANTEEGIGEEIFVSVTEIPVYTGEAITVSPEVSFRGRVLKEGEDYTLSFLNNVDAGVATGLVWGIGDFENITEGPMKEFSFVIAPMNLEDGCSMAMTWKEFPEICQLELSCNGNTLILDEDYKLYFAYADDYSNGTTLTLVGINNYTGIIVHGVGETDAEPSQPPSVTIQGGAMRATSCDTLLLTILSEPSYNPTWSSSDPKTATVQNGEIRFHKPGQVTITATIGDQVSIWNTSASVTDISKARLQGCRLTRLSDSEVCAEPFLIDSGARVPADYYTVSTERKGDRIQVIITGRIFFTGSMELWYDAETLLPCIHRDDGWYELSDGWAYWQDGAYLTGSQTIDGRVMQFSNTGILQTGWYMEGWNIRYLPGRDAMPKTVTLFYPLPATDKPELAARLSFDLLPGEYTTVVIPMEDKDADACIYRMGSDGSFEAIHDTKIRDGNASVTIWESCTLVLARAEKLPFTDMPEGDRFYPAVAWAFRSGVTTGRTETEFRPKETCTRAQVVTFLWRAAGSPEPSIRENPFTDVQPGKYYYKAVLWAVGEGITTGKTATTFLPDDTVKREQFVTFLWRYAGKPLEEGGAPFTDVTNEKGYYYQPVIWACRNGITNGTGNGKFGVDVDCNRAQTVMFLYRFFEDKPVTAAGAIMLSDTSVTLSGEPYRLTGTVLPEMADNKTILWSSSNPAVVEVDANGLLTPKGTGQAVITAKCGSAVAYCHVTSVCPHDKETTDYVPPTCTTPGFTESSHCRLCGEVFSVGQEIPATGHLWVEADCTQPRHCANCDLTIGSAPGHQMVNGTCTVCGYNREKAKREEIEAENKRYSSEVARIEGSYDAQIELKENTVESLMDQCGVSYLQSESYYRNRAATLQSEISDLYRKLVYASSAAEQRQIQKQIDSKSAEATECLTLANAAKMKAEIPALKSAKSSALAAAKREHEQKLKAIEEKYA